MLSRWIVTDITFAGPFIAQDSYSLRGSTRDLWTVDPLVAALQRPSHPIFMNNNNNLRISDPGACITFTKDDCLLMYSLSRPRAKQLS
jgi:hypothetical protein